MGPFTIDVLPHIEIPYENTTLDQWAEKLVQTTYAYLSRDRNEASFERCVANHKDGKIAEWTCYLIATKELGLKVTPPDMIIKTQGKSFSKDLSVLLPEDKMMIHVKSQTKQMAERIYKASSGQKGFSISFQYGKQELGHFDDFIDTRKEKESLWVCSTDGTRGTLRGAILSKYITDDMFEDPFYSHRVGQKKAIYFRTLHNLGEEVLWSSVIQAQKQS